ncbi:hypothetical protein SNEBB_001964 [Seison nebaliae]|nr:hypothetical protein SNEBB_001964 [Seison nebaliae]
MYMISLTKCRDGIGIKIGGGSDVNSPIFIKRLLPNGLARKEKRLKEGQEIISINGNSCRKITREKAIEYLRKACATDHLKLVVKSADVDGILSSAKNKNDINIINSSSGVSSIAPNEQRTLLKLSEEKDKSIDKNNPSQNHDIDNNITVHQNQSDDVIEVIIEESSCTSDENDTTVFIDNESYWRKEHQQQQMDRWNEMRQKRIEERLKLRENSSNRVSSSNSSSIKPSEIMNRMNNVSHEQLPQHRPSIPVKDLNKIMELIHTKQNDITTKRIDNLDNFIDSIDKQVEGKRFENNKNNKQQQQQQQSTSKQKSKNKTVEKKNNSDAEKESLSKKRKKRKSYSNITNDKTLPFSTLLKIADIENKLTTGEIVQLKSLLNVSDDYYKRIRVKDFHFVLDRIKKREKKSSNENDIRNSINIPFNNQIISQHDKVNEMYETNIQLFSLLISSLQLLHQCLPTNHLELNIASKRKSAILQRKYEELQTIMKTYNGSNKNSNDKIPNNSTNFHYQKEKSEDLSDSVLNEIVADHKKFHNNFPPNPSSVAEKNKYISNNSKHTGDRSSPRKGQSTPFNKSIWRVDRFMKSFDFIDQDKDHLHEDRQKKHLPSFRRHNFHGSKYRQKSSEMKSREIVYGNGKVGGNEPVTTLRSTKILHLIEALDEYDDDVNESHRKAYIGQELQSDFPSLYENNVNYYKLPKQNSPQRFYMKNNELDQRKSRTRFKNNCKRTTNIDLVPLLYK